MPTFDYTVNDEPESTEEHVLTPVQILQSARINPATDYLVQIEGQHQISYQNNPNAEIRMHERMRFISIPTGPTPVS